MLLTEIFDSGSQIEWEYDDFNVHGAQRFYKISVNGNHDYSVSFTKRPVKFIKGVFKVVDPEIKSKIQSNTIWDIQFAKMKDGSPTAQITGSGSELKVFGAVLEVIRDFNKRNSVDVFTFAAAQNEPSRVKLYDRMYKYAMKWFDMTSHEFVDSKAKTPAKRYVLVKQ